MARGSYGRRSVSALVLAALAAACGPGDPRTGADRSRSSAVSTSAGEAAASAPDIPTTVRPSGGSVPTTVQPGTGPVPAAVPPAQSGTSAPAPAAGRTAPSTTAAPGGTPAALFSPAGVVVPVLGPAPGGGWTVRTPCDRTVNLTGARSVGSPTIVLDPGHGGSEPGAVSPGGLAEAGINLAVARIAQGTLEAQGIPTLLTRTADYTMELPTRAEIARNVAPRAFVSVHHNAEPDEASPRPGSETYYQIGSSDSKRLAGLIYEEITRALSQYRIAWVADRDAGAKYRPGRQGDYYAMLRLPGKVVSVLAELAFISDPPEAALLGRPDVQRVEGEALARGIARWLRTADPGSGFTEPYPRTDPAPGPGGPGPVCRDPQL